MATFLGSTALEVGIGLFFAYTLLSLICTQANEIIAGLTKMRAVHLEQGIKDLLQSKWLADQVLNHPLHQAAVITDRENWLIRWAARCAKDRPSYMVPANFARALLDSIVNPCNSDGSAAKAPQAISYDAVYEAAQRMARNDSSASDRLVGQALLTLIYTSARARPAATLDQLKAWVQTLELSDETSRSAQAQIRSANSLEDLRTVLERLPPELPIRSLALSALDAGARDLDAVQATVEAWFNSAMDRASGVYKRQVGVWLLVIALGVTLLTGADTFSMVHALTVNPAVRTELVTAASQATGSSSAISEPSRGATGSVGGSAALPSSSASDTVAALSSYNLGFFYTDRPQSSDGNDWVRWAGSKALGMLITAVALSLGAPFWFDVLKRVANIRAAGTPPQTSSSS